MEPISVGIRTLAKAERRSPKSIYQLIAEGKIESFVEGSRRRVILASYKRYLDSLTAEQQGGTAIKLPVGNPSRRAEDAPAIAAGSIAPQRRGSTVEQKRHRATAPPKKKTRLARG